MSTISYFYRMTQMACVMLVMSSSVVQAQAQAPEPEVVAEAAATCGAVATLLSGKALECKGEEYEALGGEAYQAGGALNRYAKTLSPERAEGYALRFIIRNDKADNSAVLQKWAPVCQWFIKDLLNEINQAGEKYQISSDIDFVALTNAIAGCTKK